MNSPERTKFFDETYPDFVDFINSYPDMRVWGNYLEFMRDGKTVRKVRVSKLTHVKDYKKCVLDYRATLGTHYRSNKLHGQN